MELYRKVRLACRDGMSERAAARHFGISRESGIRVGPLRSQFDTFGQEPRERLHVLIDARSVERGEIGVAIIDTDHGPRIAAGCEQRIHDDARHAAVAVRVRVDMAEQPVPEDRPH